MCVPAGAVGGTDIGLSEEGVNAVPACAFLKHADACMFPGKPSIGVGYYTAFEEHVLLGFTILSSNKVFTVERQTGIPREEAKYVS